FEPAAQGLPVHGISSAAPSAARSPLRKNWRRGEDLNPRGTYAPIRFRVGRLQPGSATPPRSQLHLFISCSSHYPARCCRRQQRDRQETRLLNRSQVYSRKNETESDRVFPMYPFGFLRSKSMSDKGLIGSTSRARYGLGGTRAEDDHAQTAGARAHGR